MFPVRRLRRILSAGLLVLAALAASELAARRFITTPRLPAVLEKPPFHHTVIDSAPRGIATPAHFSCNRWGMRGGEPPRDWRGAETWVALGSSTTECTYLDDSRTWPRRLADKLSSGGRRAWIGNAGQDGITSHAGVTMMDRLIRTLRPDGVLVLMSANDLVLSLYEDRRLRGSPYDHALERRIERADWRGSLLQRSSLYRELRFLILRLRAREPSRISHALRSFSLLPLAGPEDSLPSRDSLLPSLPRFRENLLRMHALAGEMGVRAVFLTHPYRYGVDSAWATHEGRILEIGGRTYRISAATDRRLLDVFNAELLSLCGEAGLECLDLAAGMPPDSLFFYDEGHFTDAGAERVATLLAEYLDRTGGVARTRAD